MTTDVIIVGKGIAGLVLSFLFDQKGISHVILERKTMVKHFALAETLPPSALPLLQSLGLRELFEECSIRKTYGYHSAWGSDRIVDNNFYFHHPYKYGLKIDKKRMLHSLEDIHRPTTFQYDHRFKLQLENGGVSTSFEFGNTIRQIDSKIVIDATGRNRAVIKLLNIPIIKYDSTTSFSCHLPFKKHPKIKHDVFVSSFKEGWGIVSGLTNAQQVVTLFSNQSSPIFQKFKEYNNWQDILKECDLLGYFLSNEKDVKVRGALANSSRPEHITGEHWLAVGDAAMAFDPLSSHGITNALYTAQQSAEVIEGYLQDGSSSSLQGYGQLLTEIFQTYLQSKDNLYSAENRWREESFWRKARLSK